MKKLHDIGVRNIEMECVGFAAFTHHVRAKGLSKKSTLLQQYRFFWERVYHLMIRKSYSVYEIKGDE